MSDHIILLSCSNGKTRGGSAVYSIHDSIASDLPAETRRELWSCRSAIAGRILAGLVEDRLRGDGNRRDSRYNIALQLGADMGVGLSESGPMERYTQKQSEIQSEASSQYLPAYERYDGRFFAHAGLETFEKVFCEECHVLIISGLYGLLLPEEPIQAYNCHVDDEVLGGGLFSSDGDAGGEGYLRISDFWKQRNLLDRILQEFIENHNRQHEHSIRYVVDLLSETSYQRLFNWDDLYGWFKKNGISWFHRMIQGVREPGFLADLGRYFRYDLVEKGFNPPQQGKVVREYLHTINESGGHLEFTKEIRPDPFTANLLEKEVGASTWRHLEKGSREDLIHGELFFHLYDARSSKQPDEIAPRIVNFFSALENELHCICGNRAGKGSLGAFVYHLCDSSLKNLWPNTKKRAAVCTELARLLAIRNRMSHRGAVTREELLTARNAILKKDSLLAALVGLKMARARY